MTALLAVAGRALASYAFLLVLVRVSGKRGIAHVAPIDFVMVLVLGELVDAVLRAEVGFARFGVAAGTLIVVEAILARAQARSAALRAWLAGEPRLVLRRGEPCHQALRRERVREDELDAHLRVHGLERDRWRYLDQVLLENRGVVSMRKAPRAEVLERRDLAETGRTIFAQGEKLAFQRRGGM